MDCGLWTVDLSSESEISAIPATSDVTNGLSGGPVSWILDRGSWISSPARFNSDRSLSRRSILELMPSRDGTASGLVRRITAISTTRRSSRPSRSWSRALDNSSMVRSTSPAGISLACAVHSAMVSAEASTTSSMFDAYWARKMPRKCAIASDMNRRRSVPVPASSAINPRPAAASPSAMTLTNRAYTC